MAAHATSWPRRAAFGVNEDTPGVNPNHFEAVGYYSVTDRGAAEVIRVRAHVWVATKYDELIAGRDRHGMAFEPVLVRNIECSVLLDGWWAM